MPAPEGRSRVEPDDRRRVEIVHESLLSAWPRLVRWQTQDADGAQLRDQVRQAALLWEERGQPDDLLWTGTSFQEFELWRERYAGGLSEREQAFAAAMKARAELQRRRRRLAITAAFVLAVVIAATLGGFWLRSESARREAVAAERQAQASNLYGLARMQPEEEPTAFLAYATASLEQADNEEVRREIVRALWKGPPGFRLPADSRASLDFSPDGNWLATASRAIGIRLWPSDGGPPVVLEGSLTHRGPGGEATAVRFSPGGDLLAHTFPTPGASPDQLRWNRVLLWSVPDGQLLRSLEVDEGQTRDISFASDGTRLFTSTLLEAGDVPVMEIRSWPLSGGEATLLARLELRDRRPFGFSFVEVDPSGRLLAWTEGGRLLISRLSGPTFDQDENVELEHDGTVVAFSFDGSGTKLATGAFNDGGVTLQIWSLTGGRPRLDRALVSKGAEQFPFLSRDGGLLTQFGAGLWDLGAPPDADPLRLRFADRLFESDVAFGAVAHHPGGRWLATGNTASVSFWPLGKRYPYVLRGHEGEVQALRYTPDGRWLLSAGQDGTIRRWPLDPGVAERSQVIHRVAEGWGSPNRLALPADGSFLAFSTRNGRVATLPFDGGPIRELRGFTSLVTTLAVEPRGLKIAAGAGYNNKDESLVRVWNLDTGEVQILDYGNPERAWVNLIRFTPEGDLLTEAGQYLRWDLGGEVPRVIQEGLRASGVVRDYSTDRRRALTTRGGYGPLALQDLETGSERVLKTHFSEANPTNRAIFDPTGTWVISAGAYPDGPISVGPVTGEEPHLFFGHETLRNEGLLGIDALAMSPDGRSFASGGQDGTIRIWPMPDLSEPPIHTLPTGELVAKLRTLTNLRVVPDPNSFTGWKLEIGEFPGWEEVPEW